jgi:dTDP-glucose 4,6-dehydratase
VRILITGGSGFIGSALIRHLIEASDAAIINVDKLTYAAPPGALAAVNGHPRYVFERVDIVCEREVARVFQTYDPDRVVHLAAESHVDRSIDGPAPFLETNVRGTYVILEAALQHWRKLPSPRQDAFRLHHVSTDEVFGSLGPTGLFVEESRYEPNSPYSATKAASDHLVRAWHHTYGLPVVVSNCSNNYGQFQFPEKLIPLTVVRALCGESLSVYGDGNNVRDWLHVEDHARALDIVMSRGRAGESYNIGGDSQRTNIAVVREICSLLDELRPKSPHRPHEQLIAFVRDRPGHDYRYAMNISKIRAELRWAPRETFASGLRKTVLWYLENRVWWENIRAERHGGTRLGVAPTG